MVQAVSVTSCSTTDLKCLCTNTAYIDKAIHCIDSTCSPADAANAYKYATFACANAGVTVPSVDSVLHPAAAVSSSAAPPPPPAATTPASAYTPPTPPYPISSSASPLASSAGNTTHSSPVVTFQGLAAKHGIEKGLIGVVAMGVVAILGAGLL